MVIPDGASVVRVEVDPERWLPHVALENDVSTRR